MTVMSESRRRGGGGPLLLWVGFTSLRSLGPPACVVAACGCCAALPSGPVLSPPSRRILAAECQGTKQKTRKPTRAKRPYTKNTQTH